MVDSFTLIAGANVIFQLYITTLGQDPAAHAEILDQKVFMLQATTRALDIIQELLPTLSSDERVELKQTYAGFTQFFTLLEASLSDAKLYSQEELSVLLAAMAEALPVYKHAFLDNDAAQLREKLKADKARFTGKDAELIQKMLDELDRQPPSKSP
jgi:hypothetical protein